LNSNLNSNFLIEFASITVGELVDNRMRSENQDFSKKILFFGIGESLSDVCPVENVEDFVYVGGA